MHVGARVGGRARQVRPVNVVPRALARMTTAIALVALMLAMGLLMPLAAAASQPKEGTFFEYKYTERIGDGTGEYYGWWDKTKAEGRYEVLAWGPDMARMTVHQTWRYTSYDAGSDSGSLDRWFSFNLTDRLYTSPQTDLDDPLYNQYAPDELGQWLWVPPSVREGDSLYILAENSTVTDTDHLLWSRWVPRRVIEVVVTGTWQRDDDYGVFDYTYTDRLYFDKATGMFVAEHYDEYDDGTWEGLPAGFHRTIEIDLTDSSYKVEVDWGVAIVAYAKAALWITLVVLLLGSLAYWSRWRARTIGVRMKPEGEGHGFDAAQHTDTMGIYGPGNVARLKETIQEMERGHGVTDVRMMRIWRAGKFPLLENSATDQFGEFLEHWARKSLLCGDRVAIAREERGKRLIGIAYYNKEGRIGTVLCRNTELNEYLRQFVGCKDFFSETNHVITPPSWADRGLKTKLGKIQNAAYNIFETHNVYRLEPVPEVAFDAGLVRPMREGDLREVSALAKRVYRSPAKRWIRACLRSGDLCYVAVADGRIVGFGMACMEGTHGRLHTLGVDPAYRGRGIAKQLHRARLEAMRRMGATDVIDEIADWNLASIRISTLSGFKPVGKVYVETVRRRRIKKNIVRR